MREPCRIIIRYNTQFDYGTCAVRLVRRTIRQQAMHDRYEGVHTGIIQANRCDLIVFRLDGRTEWTSIFDHVVLLGGFRFDWFFRNWSSTPPGLGANPTRVRC